jgi:hypothetical protein
MGKKFYYLSMCRTRLGRYHVQNNSASSTLITLNGDLLNQRYKTSAVDYWGEEYRKHRQGAYEEEDRLFSNKPTIPDARKYIMQVDVLMPIDVMQKVRVRQLLKLCYLHKIPCYIYENSKDWLIGNKARSTKVDISTLAPQPTDEKNEPWDRYEGMRGEITKSKYLEMNKFKRKSYVRDAVELYHKKIRSDLSLSAEKFAMKISRDWAQEMFSVFSSEVHNERSNPPAERTNIDALIKILLSTKMTSREFFDHLKAKWEPIMNKQDD